MNSMSASRDTVIHEISKAFGTVQLGDGITLEEAVLMEGGNTLEDVMRNRKRSNVKRWQDVPDADIESYYDVQSFLDADGYRFYLPAYMTWVLKNFDRSDSSELQTIDWTIYSLVPREDPQLLERQMRRFSKLTQDESKAILGFLSYMARQDDNDVDTASASEAIDTFWKQYANA